MTCLKETCLKKAQQLSQKSYKLCQLSALQYSRVYAKLFLLSNFLLNLIIFINKSDEQFFHKSLNVDKDTHTAL